MASYLWFLDTLVTVRISRSDGSDKISILEHRAAQGESPEGGRWQTITAPGDFERFVLEVARPAERVELPDPSGPPTPEAAAALTEAAARFGIEIVGPPLH